MILTTHNLLNAVFSSVYMTELNASPSHPEQPRRKKHLSTVLVANGYPPFLLKKVTKTRNPTPERETAEFKSTAVIPYIKEVPEPFRRHLQQQEIRTVFKSDTTLRSRLVRQKDPADPNKQDGVVYKIRCTCGKVYIGETGRSMQERMKEHDSDIWLARTQNSAVSEHANGTGHKPLWNETKLIDRERHWYTRKEKEAIHIRLDPNNINRDSGAEIPEAWMPTISLRKHLNQRRTKNQPTPGEAMIHGNNRRIEMHHSQQTTMIYNAVPQPVDPIAWRRLAVSSRNVAFHIKWPCRETTEQTYKIR